MKSKRSFRRLMAVLVFTLVAFVMSVGVARAGGFAQPMPLGEEKTAQPQASTPSLLDGVRKVQITDKNIVVTLDAPERKSKKRTLTIDYSKAAPSLTSSKAGIGGRSPLYYGIVGFILYMVLGRVRRMVRRVAHR